MDSGSLLRACRMRAGLSQRELARRAGTSPSAICNYERGDRTPRADTLARLVAATGATLILDSIAPGAIDTTVNGNALADILELVDHLPKRNGPRLEAPPFAHTVDAHQAGRS